MIDIRINTQRLVLTGILFALGSWSACANLVSIEYFDQAFSDAVPGSGGPLWSGVVDTVTNRLRIDTWTELPRHSVEFWVPINLPIVWDARDSNGDIYDIPDSFGTTFAPNHPPDDLTATIGSDFAFISPLTAQEMQWKERTFTFDEQTNEVLSVTEAEVSYTGFGVFMPGWGGYAKQTLSGFDYITDLEGSETFDEHIIPRLPISTFSFSASVNSTITVTDRTITPVAHITSVPEPSAFLGVALIGSASVVGVWIRNKATFSRRG